MPLLFRRKFHSPFPVNLTAEIFLCMLDAVYKYNHLYGSFEEAPWKTMTGEELPRLFNEGLVEVIEVEDGDSKSRQVREP